MSKSYQELYLETKQEYKRLVQSGGKKPGTYIIFYSSETLQNAVSSKSDKDATKFNELLQSKSKNMFTLTPSYNTIAKVLASGISYNIDTKELRHMIYDNKYMKMLISGKLSDKLIKAFKTLNIKIKEGKTIDDLINYLKDLGSLLNPIGAKYPNYNEMANDLRKTFNVSYDSYITLEIGRVTNRIINNVTLDGLIKMSSNDVSKMIKTNLNDDSVVSEAKVGGYRTNSCMFDPELCIIVYIFLAPFYLAGYIYNYASQKQSDVSQNGETRSP